MSSRHTTEQLRALRVRWLAGEDLGALANERSVSVSRLAALWTERGLSAELPRRGRPRVSGVQIKAIHARWCAGESIVALAEEVGLPRSTLYAILRRSGLSLQRPAGIPGNGGDFDAQRRRQRRRWYRWASAQRREGWSWSRIHRALQELGYPASKATLCRAVTAWERKVYKGAA